MDILSKLPKDFWGIPGQIKVKINPMSRILLKFCIELGSVEKMRGVNFFCSAGSSFRDIGGPILAVLGHFRPFLGVESLF